MSFSIRLGNFLYNNVFALYRPLYYTFKHQQDKFEIELLKKIIKPGDTVLDIGANIGFYASIVSDLVGDKGTVHCFEPDLKNFKYLQRAMKGRSNVVLNQNAVGAKNETLKFYSSPNLNVDHRSYEPEVYSAVTEVQAVAIDAYLQKYGSSVQVIKMDIQGFEMQALSGMKACLENNPNIQLISEFWPYGLRTAGSSLIQYFEKLQSHGFSVQLMEKERLKELNLEEVQKLNELGEEHYFNIFATRKHV
jgi:FkbM family methyltransferase